MSDLLTSLNAQLSATMVEQLGINLGENPSHINKAMGGLLPTVLGGLINKTGDSGVMSTVMGMLGNKSNQGLLDSVASMLGGNALRHNHAENPAACMIAALFDNKVDSVLGAISAISCIKPSSASSLMGLASNLVLGMLGKKVADGMELSGLTHMLTKQAPSIMAALPGGLGNMLGFRVPTIPNLPNVPHTNERSNAWPWIALFGALGLLLFWWQWRNAPAAPATAIAEAPKLDALAGTVPAATRSAAPKASGFVRKLSSGFELRGDSTGIERGLVGFVDSEQLVDKTTWFNFDHLTFKSGSAALDIDKSTDQLNNISEILKAFPTVHLKIGGYTDNTGSAAANTILSQQRADNAMRALIGNGIEKTRLTAEGYGPQFPACAANDTDACKARNRRIAVRVTKK